jgi:hypothetical protein
MVVLRDDKRIATLGKVGRWLSLAGLLALVAGLLFIFIPNQNVFLYQLIALMIGWALAQVGLYLSHRFLRKPRPDQVLDKAAKPVARKDGRLYHYLLPAPHVLLLPGAVVVLVAKYQTGRISAYGDQWKQGGLGMRRYFGQENLGDPTKDAEKDVSKMAAFIAENAPEAVGTPVTPIIVFTAENIDSLDIKESRIPAVHHSKLAGVIKQRKELQIPMPREQYDALRAAFDAKAPGLAVETLDADPA